VADSDERSLLPRLERDGELRAFRSVEKKNSTDERDERRDVVWREIRRGSSWPVRSLVLLLRAIRSFDDGRSVTTADGDSSGGASSSTDGEPRLLLRLLTELGGGVGVVALETLELLEALVNLTSSGGGFCE